MKNSFYFFFIVLCVSSCKKDPDIISNNDAPYYGEISTLLLENYVNRIYIDLIGREPLDNEMLNDVQFLRDADTFGKQDPYAKFTYDGVDFMTTVKENAGKPKEK